MLDIHETHDGQFVRHQEYLKVVERNKYLEARVALLETLREAIERQKAHRPQSVSFMVRYRLNECLKFPALWIIDDPLCPR